MNRGILALGFVALMLVALSSGAAVASPPMGQPALVVVMPSTVKWEPVKDMSGLEMAVLYGDPSKAGSQYAERYKVPAGFKFPPHSHPMWEEVTVLSGTFMVALGDKWDATKLTALPAGSYLAIPPQVNHYGQAKDDCILELHGIGPDTMNMVK